MQMEEEQGAFTWLSDIDEEDVDWLSAENWFLKGEVNQIVGEMDNGKSFFTVKYAPKFLVANSLDNQ